MVQLRLQAGLSINAIAARVLPNSRGYVYQSDYQVVRLVLLGLERTGRVTRIKGAAEQGADAWLPADKGVDMGEFEAEFDLHS